MAEKINVPEIRFAGFIDPWEQRKLGNCGTAYGGLTGKTKEDFGHGNARFIPYTNVFDNPLADTKRLEAVEIDSSQNQVAYGDAFFTVSSETPDEVGMSSVWLSDQEDVYLNSFCFGYRQDSTFDPHYLAYMLRSRSVRSNLTLLAQGISRFNISKNKVMELSVPVPSAVEQKQLGQYFTKLDSLITLHQRKFEKLVQLKKSMLDKMFPKPGERFPEIRFAGFTDPWEQRKLGELTTILSAVRVHKEEWRTAGVPFYRSSDVMAAFKGTENERVFISQELFEQLSAQSGAPQKGDVMVTGGGSVGTPYIVPDNKPLYTKDADLIWIKRHTEINPKFLYSFFISPIFKSYIRSISHVGTIAHYTIEQVKETPLLMPCSIVEQKAIGSFLGNLDSLITLHQRKLELLRNTKKSLLDRMFV